jgi:probable F420-dependent oxidoreductase
VRISINTFLDGNQEGPLADYVLGLTHTLEERGFAGVWLGEHLVGFRTYEPAYPYPYNDDGSAPPILSQVGLMEPMTTLAAMAMCSKTLRLGTGIAILPQRNPVYFAKEGAAVDLLSNGRFIAGVGLGWSGQEFAATGTPFEHRGSRMNEYLEVVRSLWVDETSRFEGRFYTLPECIQLPKPVQRPHPPFYFGGESAVAMRRIAQYGQGWFGLYLKPEDVAPRLALLTEELGKRGRSLSEIDLVVSPGNDPCDERMLEAYAAQGVAEVVAVCFGKSLDDFRREADRMARELVEPASKL